MRMSNVTKFGLVICATVIVSGTAIKLAEAADWPSKPIKAIVPVGAGSTTDLVHRAVLEQLSSQLGQNIVVENRSGAGGTIGASLVARATPDGYTILAHGSAHTIAPSLYRNLGYDPIRDFAAVVPVGVSPSVLVVSPASGIRTIAEFVAAAKAKPGTFNFSSVGNGTATHLSAKHNGHRISSSCCASSCVMISGGSNRITLSAVTLINSPLARASLTRSPQGLSSSMPIINPWPRISLTPFTP